MLKIGVISDTHTMHHKVVFKEEDELDVIICAGDISGQGAHYQIDDFLNWFGSQPATYKILVPGNHDLTIEGNEEFWKKKAKEHGVILLVDEEITIDKVLFYGSPQTPFFCKWGYNKSRTQEEADIRGDRFDFIGDYWAKIPANPNKMVLITHGPPKWILDKCPDDFRAGCKLLNEEIHRRIRPDYHLFGHIHGGRGRLTVDNIHFVNASFLDDSYKIWKDKEHYEKFYI